MFRVYYTNRKNVYRKNDYGKKSRDKEKYSTKYLSGPSDLFLLFLQQIIVFLDFFLGLSKSSPKRTPDTPEAANLKFEQDVALHHEYQRQVSKGESIQRNVLQLDESPGIAGGFTLDFQYVIFFLCKAPGNFFSSAMSSFGGTCIIPFRTAIEMLLNNAYAKPPPPPPAPAPPNDSESQAQVKRHFMFTEDLLAKLKSASTSSGASGGAAREIKIEPVAKAPEMQIGKPF